MNREAYGPCIDYEFCNGCGKCYDSCPMDIFGWDEQIKKPVVEYGVECALCFICELTCSQQAIDVRLPMHARLDFIQMPDWEEKRKKH